ncbi:MAG TPA: pilus assembly protein PilM [Bryobacteraceae bacterium]|nr:pilus assembly protein PilM [Bryobacteraceae bacterium]
MSLKKWLAFGSGVGIQIAGPKGAESLHICAVRVRPSGAGALGDGGLVIEDFAHRPAGEWGAEYVAFAKKLGLGGAPAAVLLSRHDVIVRVLPVPGVSDKDLESAVRFQMDGLHPYNEEDVYFSWSRLGRTGSVLVAIARKEPVDRYAALFSEAGVKVAAFDCSAAAIYSALRLFGERPAAEVLAWDESAGGIEIYGESAAKPVFSAEFAQDADDKHRSAAPPDEDQPDAAPEENQQAAATDESGRPSPQAASLAKAEMRADPALEAKPLAELLNASSPLPFAAALLSACPRLSLPLNLLPEDRRVSSSALRWAIPAALGVVVVLLAVAFAVLPSWDRHRYLKKLDSQIAQVNPPAARSNQLDKEIEALRRRTEFLDDFRRQSKSDIDLLAELTKVLPPPTWLNLTEISPRQVLIGGETDQAEPLLKVLNSSALLEASEFQGPPGRTATGWVFRIRANRKGTRP